MFTQRHCFLISSILLIVMAAAACQPQATPQPTPALSLTAVLKELTGKVNIKQPGAGDFSPASVGVELQLTGSVKTGDDGRARLDLSSGTIIRVAPSSLFTFASNQASNGSFSTQFNLNLGTIFIILKGGNASVNTPSGVASVRGSYLSVYVDPSTQTIVTCLEGHCSAGNSAGSVDFGSGQEVTLFSCTGGQCSVPNIGPMTPEDFQRWLDNYPDIQQQIPGLFATLTAIASTQPPATEAPATPPPATEPPLCLNNLNPVTDSNLDPAGPVKFSWDAKEGASQYRLSIHYPNGATASFYTSDTSITRYLETMPAGGSYSWDVTVFDSAGNPICQTGESSFSKPKLETLVPPKNPIPPATTEPPTTPPPVTPPPTQPPGG